MRFHYSFYCSCKTNKHLQVSKCDNQLLEEMEYSELTVSVQVSIFLSGVPTMLLSLLVRQSLCRPHTPVLLPLRCLRTLQSQAEHFLRRRFPLRFQTQIRGAKTRKKQNRSQEEEWKTRNKTVLTYIAAAGVGMIGLSYASVPLYRLYCQVSSEEKPTYVPELMFGSFSCCVCLPGVGARRHGGGWPRHRTGGVDGTSEGTRHQDHLQRRHARQHSVELPAAADGDLCKTSTSRFTYQMHQIFSETLSGSPEGRKPLGDWTNPPPSCGASTITKLCSYMNFDAHTPRVSRWGKCRVVVGSRWTQ